MLDCVCIYIHIVHALVRTLVVAPLMGTRSDPEKCSAPGAARKAMAGVSGKAARFAAATEPSRVLKARVSKAEGPNVA